MKISRKGISLAAALGLAGFGSQALAQDWSENFDSYSNGQVLYNVNGWGGWDNLESVCGSATNAQSRSAPHSILIEPNDDAIRTFENGYASGTGTMRAWMYLSQAQHTADTYYIVQNEYNHGGPYQWCIELQFDVTTGTVLDDFRNESGVVNIVYGQWVELRFEINIGADTITSYYNNQEVSTGQLFIRGGTPEIKNLDLYSTGATNYFDDLAITGLQGGGPPPYTVSIIGTCPGTVRLEWSNADPNRQQGIVFARNTGNFVIPTGPCQGTQLGLGTNQLQLYNVIGTGNGAGGVNAQAGPGACRGFVQLIQTHSCAVSNVAQVP